MKMQIIQLYLDCNLKSIILLVWSIYKAKKGGGLDTTFSYNKITDSAPT